MEQNETDKSQVDAEPCFFTGLLFGSLLGSQRGGTRVVGSPGATVNVGGFGPRRPGVGPTGGPPGMMFAQPVVRGGNIRRPGVGPFGAGQGSPVYRATRTYIY